MSPSYLLPYPTSRGRMMLFRAKKILKHRPGDDDDQKSTDGLIYYFSTQRRRESKKAGLFVAMILTYILSTVDLTVELATQQARLARARATDR